MDTFENNVCLTLQDTEPDAPIPVLDAKIEATLAEGQQLVQDGQFSQALRVILEAVNMCPCDPAGEGKQRHAKDKSCHISQCMLAVNSNDPYALYEVANSPCTCGYRWPSCTRQLHAVALDALADCLDKAEQYIAAFATALATVRLDPASAVGYCRGARIIRYLLRCASPHPNSVKGRAIAVILNGANGGANAPSAVLLRGTLGRFVQSGLRITDRHRHGLKDSYHVGGSLPIPYDTRDWSTYRLSQVVLQRMAYHLNCDTAYRDPVKEFPREVLGMVFSYLDITDLIQCLGVNKQWNRLVSGDDSWNDLRLTRPGNPGRQLSGFLQQHQKIKSLVIRDASQFNLNTGHRFYQMVFGLPQLDRLCISFGNRRRHPLTVDLENTSATPRTKTRLTQLSLESFDLKTPVAQLVAFSTDTLAVLNLVNTGPNVNGVFGLICLPNLKKLRMTATLDPALHPGSAWIEMAPIVLATPNLEQLHLDGFQAAWFRGSPPTDDWDELWRSLRNLTLGPGMRCTRQLAFSRWNPRFLPPFPPSLQSLELLGTVADVASNALFTSASPAAATGLAALVDPDLTYHHLPNLEVFRCLCNILQPGHLERLLGPAVSAGKLKVLELAATRTRPQVLNGPFPPADFIPARDLNFLDRSGIHTLGLHDFNFFHDPNSRFGATSGFDGAPFVEWLDCFPDLHTLGVYPYQGDFQGVTDLITDLIARPGIRTIHQRYLRGVPWDKAQELAKEHGVELCHTPGHLPAGWKVFEDLDEWPSHAE